MKTPKPIITTTTQSFFAQYRYAAGGREGLWRDYRRCPFNPIDGRGYQYGVAYGAVQ